MNSHLVRLGALILLALVLSSCGPGNSVRLLPPPPFESTVLPAPNAPSVSVVNFRDEREDTGAVGMRRDGTPFTTTGDVSLWISRAVADELARQGYRVTFAMDVNQARAASPDYLVTGVIQEVWLKETSATSLSAQMRAACTLASRQQRLWTETCTVQQSRTTLPTGSVADALLLDTLQDLVQNVAQKIEASVQKK